MKHIRNLWNLLKQEISLWKYEKQELVKGICYIVMIAWLFFDRIAFVILLIPYLFVFMKQQRIHKVHREKKAPKGCILTKQEWTFELSENTDNKENPVIFENLSTGEKQKGSLVYENPLQKGKLLIQKEDDEGQPVIWNDY